VARNCVSKAGEIRLDIDPVWGFYPSDLMIRAMVDFSNFADELCE